MNRTISFITKMMFAAVTVIMAACSSDDNATQALTVQVKVSMPEGFKSDILYTGHTVTMGKYTAITNEKGIATFEGVIPDLYDISTSCEITAEEYEEMTGNDPQNENYVISGQSIEIYCRLVNNHRTSNKYFCQTINCYQQSLLCRNQRQQ